MYEQRTSYFVFESIGIQMDTCKLKKETRPLNVPEALKCVVRTALAQNRLVTGILDIASFLQRISSKKAMVCVIEDRGCQGWTNDEVHLKLLEAFCREHAVRLIKVRNCQYFMQSSDEFWIHASSDFKEIPHVTCMLVIKPDVCSIEDDLVMTFHDTYKSWTGSNFPCIRSE